MRTIRQRDDWQEAKRAGRLELIEGDEGLGRQVLAALEHLARRGPLDEPLGVDEGDGAARQHLLERLAAILHPVCLILLGHLDRALGRHVRRAFCCSWSGLRWRSILVGRAATQAGGGTRIQLLH